MEVVPYGTFACNGASDTGRCKYSHVYIFTEKVNMHTLCVNSIHPIVGVKHFVGGVDSHLHVHCK